MVPDIWCEIYGPFSSRRLRVHSPCIKEDDGKCRGPVWFADWKPRRRRTSVVAHSSIHACVAKLFLRHSPFHTWTKGVVSRASQPPPLWTPPPRRILGTSLGGAARCIFLRYKPWLCMGTELGGLQSRNVVESFLQWMILNDRQHLPPQAALNLRPYCLDSMW